MLINITIHLLTYGYPHTFLNRKSSQKGERVFIEVYKRYFIWVQEVWNLFIVKETNQKTSLQNHSYLFFVMFYLGSKDCASGKNSESVMKEQV